MSTWQEEELLGKAYDGRLMRRFLQYLKPQRAWVVLSLLLVFIRIGLDLVTAPILQRTIDGPIANRILSDLPMWIFLFSSAVVAMSAFEYVELLVTNLVGQRLIFDIRMRIFSHLQRLPLSFYDKNPVGRLMIRVTNDVENLNELFTSGLVAFIADIFLIIGILVMMFLTSWKLALITLAPAPLTLGAVLLFRLVARDQYRELRTKIARLNSYLNEAVNGMKTTLMFTREKTIFDRFRTMSDEYRAASNKTVLTYSIFYPTIDFLAAISGALLLGYGGISILEGNLSFGAFTSFWYLAQKFFHPVRDLSEKYNIVQAAMASSERIFKLLDEPEVISKPEKIQAPSPTGEIVFDQVRFTYDGVTPVLDDVSFTVRPGESVAIVGITGAGKTTITSLLLRLYDVTGGAIRVDGIDLRDRDPAELRKRFSLVLQDVFLFGGSVEENIRLGEPGVTPEKVRAAATAAGADRFVTRLPKGFETDVRERGTALSTGERQLLSVARALAFDRGILILDEATSSVDSESEALIQEALKKLLVGRTSVVIAHRLSTIRHVDRIIVLHKGKVAEQGSHDELIRKDGLYGKLHKLQFDGLPV